MNKSKATTPNPKDIFGSAKVSVSKLPPVAIAHAAHAMMDGAEKYGAYNWRDKPVIASIYVDAAIRHILDWWEGQEAATDSEVHHLGHAMACGAILLDAQAYGNLIDDRPVCDQPDILDEVLVRLSVTIKRRKEQKAAATAKEQERIDQSWAYVAAGESPDAELLHKSPPAFHR
jgi:hypothetical protein